MLKAQIDLIDLRPTSNGLQVKLQLFNPSDEQLTDAFAYLGGAAAATRNA
jgi:hypothetical protein